MLLFVWCVFPGTARKYEEEAKVKESRGTRCTFSNNFSSLLRKKQHHLDAKILAKDSAILELMRFIVFFHNVDLY